MSESTRNPRRTADQWQSIVNQQTQSGLSGAAFCKAEGIVYQSFMNWQKKLGNDTEAMEAGPQPQFVELTTTGEHPVVHQTHWLVELDLAPGVQLRIAR